MLLSDRPRAHYTKAPVHEVICQLQFPTILSINQEEPARFQETIRGAFPRYARQQDIIPPKITGVGTPNIQVQNQPPVTNYHFLSEDGKWKLNLTRDFIALSTLRYPGWEDFARHLDRPLASFIRTYQPAYFHRVGLRYRNFVSRKRLNLEGVAWNALLAPAYTGPLREGDVAESEVTAYSCDLALRLDDACRLKVHAGPGHLKGTHNGPQDPELKFILDLDLFAIGTTACTQSAQLLEALHGYADRAFEGAITDILRDAIR